MKSQGLNLIQLIGNVVKDPEFRDMSGFKVTTFKVATNRSWLAKDGTVKEDVQFHKVVCWSDLAESAVKELHKGDKVYVSGRMVYRTYKVGEDQQRYVAETVAESIMPLSHSVKAEEGQIDSQAASTSSETVSAEDIPF